MPFRYIRPAPAFPAVTTAVAQPASTGPDDQRFLQTRISKALGKKTPKWGTVLALGSERHLQIDQRSYDAAKAANPNIFADALYDSDAPAGSYTSTSDDVSYFNSMLQRQLICAVGDSRTNSVLGGYTPLFKDQLWSQGILPNGLEAIFPPTSSNQKIGFNPRWAHEKSRCIMNMGRDSARLVTIPNWTYTQGMAWLDNFGQMDQINVGADQQLVIAIGDTNDIPYSLDNSNPGLASVPVGTPGATYTGTINYIENVLKPFVALCRQRYSYVQDLKIVHRGMWARGINGSISARNIDVMAYLKAKKAEIGLDYGIDTTQIEHITPTVLSNSEDPAYFFDKTHWTAIAVKLMEGPCAALYDRCLGFAPDPTYSNLIY